MRGWTHPPAVAAFDGAIAAYERITTDARPLTERTEAELERAKAATQLTIHAADMVRAGVTVLLDEAVFYTYLRALRRSLAEAERDQAELVLVQAAVQRAADARALEIANRRLTAANETVTRLRASLAALASQAAEPVAEGAIKKLGGALKP